jgi:signal transduction histidine kinase
VLATVEARQTAASRELDRLRAEVVDLRASRRRLAVIDDAERRRIERELHGGMQQHLVALAANLQLAAGLIGADPPAARTLLEHVARDLDLAMAEARVLAQHIYPPLLDSGGLAVAIRSAAASANVPTRLDVEAYAACPPEIARAVYLCCLEILECTVAGTEAVVTVRNKETAVVFEVVADCGSSEVDLVGLRDRVEALGGRLTIGSQDDGATRVAGSIPLSE